MRSGRLKSVGASRAGGAASLISMVAVAAPVLRDLGVPVGASGARADGISSDGSTVVGFEGNSSIGAFRWTEAGGNINLGTPPGSTRAYATDVSANGSVVVGYGTSASRAFRWTPDGNMLVLSPLVDDRFSRAYAVSADGSMVAGESYGGIHNRAVYWSADGTGHEVGANPANSVAYGISADGSVIVGFSDPDGFRWKNGQGIDLLTPVGGWSRAVPMAVSGDGVKVVGSLSSPGTADAPGFVWTEAEGMRLLPRVLGGMVTDEFVTCISTDGALIGGAFRLDGEPYQAAIWHPVIGGMPLNDYMVRLGVNLDGWLLNSVYGINLDGTILVGSGTHNGAARAWLLTGFVPINLCPADLNHDALADDSDFVSFVAGYDILDCADSDMTLWCPADLNKDGLVDDADFVLFASAYDALICP